MKPRTLRLDDTVIVLEHVRGFRVEPRYIGEGRPEMAYTNVWLVDMPQPLVILGDHLDVLRAAIDGAANQWLVVIESPYAGDVAVNLEYARAAMRDSLLRGEYPIASHLLYTQPGILDDKLAEERALGIEAGLAWGVHASRSIVYTDRGVSDGMRIGIDRARAQGRETIERSIPGWAR